MQTLRGAAVAPRGYPARALYRGARRGPSAVGPLAGASLPVRGGGPVVPEDRVDYVGVGEAARLLGLSQRAVRNLVGRGALEAGREGEGAAARLVVSRASVERLRSEHRAAGEGDRGA